MLNLSKVDQHPGYTLRAASGCESENLKGITRSPLQVSITAVGGTPNIF